MARGYAITLTAETKVIVYVLDEGMGEIEMTKDLSAVSVSFRL